MNETEDILVFNETNIYRKILATRGASFNNDNIAKDIDSILNKLLAYRDYFVYEYFMEITKELRNSYLLSIADTLYNKLRAGTAEEFLALTDVVVAIEGILVYYEESILIASIRDTLKNARSAIRNCLEKFYCDFNESYILISEKLDNSMDGCGVMEMMDYKCGDIIACSRLNYMDKMLLEIGLLKKINKHFQITKINSLYNEAQQVEDEYYKVKFLYNTYTSIARNEYELFHSPEIEEFLLRLVDLKWKYYQEHVQIGFITKTCKDLEAKHFSFMKMLSQFYSEYLPVYFNGNLHCDFKLEVFLEYFNIIGIEPKLLRETMDKKLLAIYEIFCSVFIENLEKNVVYETYNLNPLILDNGCISVDIRAV